MLANMNLKIHLKQVENSYAKHLPLLAMMNIC